MTMDEMDLEILRRLHENSRISVQTLSKELNLSRSSISNRMLRLEEEGVLRKYTISARHEPLGYDLLFFVGLSNLRLSREETLEILEKIKDIVSIYVVTGENDLILKCVARTSDEINKLTAELNLYANTDTMIILDTPVYNKFPD